MGVVKVVDVADDITGSQSFFSMDYLSWLLLFSSIMMLAGLINSYAFPRQKPIFCRIK